MGRSKNGWTFSYPDQSLAKISANELADHVDGRYSYAAERGVPMASVVNGATKSSDDYHMAAGTVAFLSTVPRRDKSRGEAAWDPCSAIARCDAITTKRPLNEQPRQARRHEDKRD